MEALYISLAGGIGVCVGGVVYWIKTIADKHNFRSRCGCCKLEYNDDSDDEKEDENKDVLTNDHLQERINEAIRNSPILGPRQ